MGVAHLRLKEFAAPKGIVGGPFGSNLVKRDYMESGVPVVRGQNLAGDGYFNDRDFVFVSPDKVECDLARNLAIPGDVVFTQRGTLGQVGVIPTGSYDRYVISQSQMRMRVDPSRADARFIYYCFRQSEMISLIRSRAIATGVPHINLGILESLPIPSIPIAEQQAIAEVLGALDEKIAVNERIADTVMELALALYRGKREGRDWLTIPMGEAAQWLSGGTPKTAEPAFWNGDIPWIAASGLKSPWIVDSERRVTQLGSESGTRLVQRETVIFVVRGSSLDTEFRIGITQREVAFGQDCKALIAGKGIDPAVLFVAIKDRTEEVLGLVDHTGHGAGRLSTDLIAKLPLRLPDSGDAADVAAKIRSLLDLGATHTVENRTLAELRDTLLPQLVTGKLRIKDAERVVEDAV